MVLLQISRFPNLPVVVLFCFVLIDLVEVLKHLFGNAIKSLEMLSQLLMVFSTDWSSFVEKLFNLIYFILQF